MVNGKRLLSVLLVGVMALAITNGIVGQAAARGGRTDTPTICLICGPGQSYGVVAVLDPNTALIFEARNADLSWLLGHTPDGALRGWVASLYLRYEPGFAAARLPVSGEVLAAPAPAVSADAPVAPAVAAAPAGGVAGTGAEFAPDAVAFLSSVPIVPAISPRAREIFLLGQSMGNDPRGLTKVGECNSMSWAFLMPFALGTYDLGAYSQLQTVVDYFPAYAWAVESLAAQPGFASTTLIDPMMAKPGACAPGQTPLECEYERTRPSVAFINLGVQDVLFLSPQEYAAAMRQIIEISINRGVIPVLCTFPIWPYGDTPDRIAKRLDFNIILVNLAREYDVPLMNLWLATQSVTHNGIGEDLVHFTERGGTWIMFNGEEHEWGFTMWNLIALQTLDRWRTSALAN